MKKIIAAALSLALVLSFSVTYSSAGYLTDEQLDEMIETFSKRCEDILTAVNHAEYFDGGCAEWTSDQLKGNGIGYWFKGNYNNGFGDANTWLDGLDDGAVTETGYTQVKYYGESCLSDLVAEYGNYPVYNIVVVWEHGSEKWFSEGHVCYVWCIYDGVVYYSDTFSRINAAAGQLVGVPLDEFEKAYESFNGSIIGAVHFEGAEDIHYRLTERMTTEFIIDRDCTLRGAPAFEVNGEDTAEGALSAGEKICVTGAYLDPRGDRWLKLDGGGWISYSDAHKEGNYSTLSLEGASVPIRWRRQLAFDLFGTVRSYSTPLTGVEITVKDTEGNICLGGNMPASGELYSITEFDKNAYFEHLAEGTYTYTIKASNSIETAVLFSGEFTVESGGRTPLEQDTVSRPRRIYDPADADLSGAVDSTDLERVINTVFSSNRSGTVYLSDVNGDGSLNLTDIARTAQLCAGQ